MLYLGIDQHAKQFTISLRNDAGDIVLKRQVSTEPKRCAEFFAKLQERAGDERYIAIVEVCGFNDWLLKLLPTVGCTQTILIQPTKKLKVKTDKRDAHALSELLWVNQHRLRLGEPVRGVRQVTLPTKHHAESQRLTLLRKDAGRMRTRATNRIKNILRKHNLQWQLPTNALRQFMSQTRPGQAMPGASAVDDFAAQAQRTGYDVVGREVTVNTPFGARRYDVVVRDRTTGGITGVEIKSSRRAFSRFDEPARQQFAADRWLRAQGGLEAVGQNRGLFIEDAIKILWEIP